MSGEAEAAASEDAGSLRGGRFGALFVALLLLASIPLLLAALPPLFDYPNHLARMYLLLHLPGSDALRRYYELNWQPLPNLGMDLVVPVLARFLPLAEAGRAFIFACFVAVAGGAALLHRAATGRWSLWPLFAFLFLYSRVLLWGFLNYLFGVGLALTAMALWILLERRPAAFRLAVSAVFALALFFCHLMACVLYGVMVLGYELGALWRRPQGRRPTLLRIVFAGMPFLPPLTILSASGGGGLVAIHYGRFIRKLDLLFSVFDNYDRVFDIAGFAALVLAAGFAYYRRWLVLSPSLRGPLVALALAFVAAPTQIMTASAVDHRMPLAVALVLAAATTAPGISRPAARRMALAGLALLLLRLGWITVYWERAQEVYQRDIAVLDRTPEGGRLAVAFPAGAIASDPVPRTHLPTLAIIRRDAFVPTLFAFPRQQPVAFTAEAARLVAAAEPSHLWRALMEPEARPDGTLAALSGFDALVVLDRRPFTLHPPSWLVPLAVEPNFALYRIERAPAR